MKMKTTIIWSMTKSFKEKIKVIISCGGTGGHIYPAIAVANEIKRRNKMNEILFIGSNDRMEMKIIPNHNFEIIGLWISGIKRTSLWKNIIFFGIPFVLKNFLLPIKLVYSIIRSIFIINSFKPDIVIGFGGYTSGPSLIASILLGTNSAIQEQNSYPGITNRYLGKKVDLVFVAFKNLERFFSKKLYYFGNPVRSNLLNISKLKSDAIKFFGLKNNKKTLLLMGGSLGSKTINDSVMNNLSIIKNSSFQILWQTGKNYYDEILLKKDHIPSNIIFIPFIKEMNYAYASSDIIISRAGALAISELCMVGKPVVLVPSPNVVEDHQTKNALYLKSTGACEVVKDQNARKDLIKKSFQLLNDKNKMSKLKKNISLLSKPNATKKIVDKLFDKIII